MMMVMVALVSTSLISCSRGRQQARTTESESSANYGRISLRDEPTQTAGTGLGELSSPQYEVEKPTNYSFNRARHLFDLNLEKADLRSTLQSLCDMLELNLVMDRNIEDSLTVNLHDVTFYKFLEVAFDDGSYDYRVDGNFLYVTLPVLETRIYNMNYLNTARQVQGTMTITGQGGGASGGLVPQSTTTLQTQAQINLWGDISNTLQAIVLNTGAETQPTLTSTGSFAGQDVATGFKLVIEPNSGLVQVTASRKVLDEVDDFLTALEKSLQRQVMIEARFIEINLDNNFQTGIDWTGLPSLISSTAWGGGLDGGNLVSIKNSPGARDMQIGISNDKIGAIMTALNNYGKVNVLQSPQVSTLNNQPAVIRVARNETFFQRVETPGTPATATSAATQSVVNYTPVQQPTGVVLNITPQIGDDGMIIMSIRPSITAIASVATSPDGLSTSPITDVRELDTVAKVRHGQTVILAGLIQERELETNSDTPGISKIPILGNLFKQKVKQSSKIELVILLTPYINYSKSVDEIQAGEFQKYKDVAERYDLKEQSFKR